MSAPVGQWSVKVVTWANNRWPSFLGQGILRAPCKALGVSIYSMGVIFQKVWAHCGVFRESLTILGTGV